MEVHRTHSHGGGKKKWSEHLFEFLLLFLAVFAGFVSENIRESIVEKHRTKQYISFLIRDLKSDTAQINSLIEGNQDLIKTFDTLVSKMIDYPGNKDVKSLLYYVTWSHQFFTFQHTSRAIDQLENSGQLRLIDDINLTDAISDYYENAKSTEDYGRLYMDYSKVWHQLEYQIFDYSQIGTTQNARSLDVHTKFTLISEDPKLIKEFINQVMHWRDMLYSLIAQLKYMSRLADSTLKYLEKE